MRATTLLLSLLPLASCISGYILSVYYFSKPSCEVPQLAGLSLAQALIRVGQKELTLKILSDKHEPHAKPGTILMQKPAAGMRLKQHQTVFVVIAQEPPAMIIPDFNGMTIPQAQARCQELGIQPAIVQLHHHAPLGSCMGQVPVAGSPVDGTLTLYFSAGEQSLRIMPNLVGCPIDEVRDFLQGYGILVTEVPREVDGNGLEAGTVLAQKPSAGSCIDLKKAAIVQLVVLQI